MILSHAGESGRTKAQSCSTRLIAWKSQVPCTRAKSRVVRMRACLKSAREARRKESENMKYEQQLSGKCDLESFF